MKVDPPDLSMAERVDRACDQFEADWRSGKRPRIEDVLGSAEGEQRSKLLWGILLVELELLRVAGEAPSLDEYRRRGLLKS